MRVESSYCRLTGRKESENKGSSAGVLTSLNIGHSELELKQRYEVDVILRRLRCAFNGYLKQPDVQSIGFS